MLNNYDAFDFAKDRILLATIHSQFARDDFFAATRHHSQTAKDIFDRFSQAFKPLCRMRKTFIIGTGIAFTCAALTKDLGGLIGGGLALANEFHSLAQQMPTHDIGTIATGVQQHTREAVNAIEDYDIA